MLKFKVTFLYISASKVRLATLEMSVLLLKQLVYRDVQCFLQDRHLAAIEGAREESTLLLRNFYKVWEKVHMHRTLLVFLGCGFEASLVIIPYLMKFSVHGITSKLVF